MAEYKLSELNSIDTVRSDDLLHLRVIKRSDMLGDEDRKMTYANFLASFKLERFLQLVGGTMTGNLGIVKLTYGGKDLLDPTGASEVIIGDVAKTFKVNANGLRLMVADATRTANVYHTLNKPTPNELGMRTNAENDARYAQLATENTFLAKQTININGVGLTLKSIYPDAGAFIEARDSTNAVRFTVGNLDSSSDVTLVNSKGAKLTLGTTTVSLDKTLTVNGQVQPNDWGNFDTRFFTKTAADQRFAKLTGDNTLTGVNRFIGKAYVTSDGNALNLRASSANAALFLQAYASTGTETWYLGQPDGSKSDINLFNQMTGAALRLSTEFFFSKSLNVTGQVKPSDLSNFDSRYVPSSLTNVLARTNTPNTFNGYQTFLADETPVVLKNVTLNAPLYIASMNANNVRRWYIGNGSPNSPETLFITNDTTGAVITLSNTVNITKTVGITGQVQPTDLSNFDNRYYTKGVSDSRFMNTTAIGAAVAADGGVLWNAKTGLYNLTSETGGSTDLLLHLFQGPSSTPSAQLRVRYRNGGVWYRSSRDGVGFEEAWTKIYNERDKPTPAELGAYTKAETDQKIATAITNSTDLNKIYPVGIVTFFASNVNPNTAFAGTTWTYLTNGNQRTIRVAQPDGSDVGQVGGSDSKSIAVGHLPSHTHSFSATTSSFDYGTKSTTGAGGHSHTFGGNTSTNGDHAHSGSGRTNFSQAGSYYATVNAGTVTRPSTNTAGAHYHSFSGGTSTVGDHAHSVGIGAHSHTISGNTGGTGSGAAFDVTNSFIKLMTWVRTA